jgi:plastocyanin
MKRDTLVWVLTVFMASTAGVAGCRSDDPPKPAGGTGGAGGKGGTGAGGSKTGGTSGTGAGGSKAGGAGGTAAGGAGGKDGGTDVAAAGGAGDAAADGAGDAEPGGVGDGGSDGGGAGGAGGTTMDTAPETADAVVNGCTKFEDESGAGAQAFIDWKNPLTSTQKCVQIKAGQTVTFGPAAGSDFAMHPLRASGGDTPNPIQPKDTGDADYVVTFPNVGIYGFKCNVHPVMTGAIKVIP